MTYVAWYPAGRFIFEMDSETEWCTIQNMYFYMAFSESWPHGAALLVKIWLDDKWAQTPMRLLWNNQIPYWESRARVVGMLYWIYGKKKVQMKKT